MPLGLLIYANRRSLAFFPFLFLGWPSMCKRHPHPCLHAAARVVVPTHLHVFFSSPCPCFLYVSLRPPDLQASLGNLLINVLSRHLPPPTLKYESAEFTQLTTHMLYLAQPETLRCVYVCVLRQETCQRLDSNSDPVPRTAWDWKGTVGKRNAGTPLRFNLGVCFCSLYK